MKQNVIDTIHSKTFLDYTSNKASDAEINAFASQSNVILDREYKDFLKKLNGFELNGLNFYGTKEQPEIYVLDALKQNIFWTIEIPALKEYFIIADGDMDFYCYHTVEKKYYALSKAGLIRVEMFENFDSMIESLLKIY
jgi:hypothetical protein